MKQFFDILLQMVHRTFLGSADDVQAACDTAHAEWMELKERLDNLSERVRQIEGGSDAG